MEGVQPQGHGAGSTHTHTHRSKLWFCDRDICLILPLPLYPSAHAFFSASWFLYVVRLCWSHPSTNHDVCDPWRRRGVLAFYTAGFTSVTCRRRQRLPRDVLLLLTTPRPPPIISSPPLPSAACLTACHLFHLCGRRRQLYCRYCSHSLATYSKYQFIASAAIRHTTPPFSPYVAIYRGRPACDDALPTRGTERV